MIDIIKYAGALTLAGAPEGFDALVMGDLARARRGMTVFVARDPSRAAAFADALAFFAPEVEVITFPAWDCLPFDRVGPSAGVAARRMAALSRLARGLEPGKPCLLLTTAPAVMQRVPPRAAVGAAGYSAKVGNSVDIGRARALLRGQRLPAGLDGVGEGRVRRPRRRDRCLSARRR